MSNRKTNRLQRSQPPNRDLFLVDAVAARLSWHPESLRRAIRSGRVHAVKLGKTWRIAQSEIDRVIAEGVPA